MGSLLTSGETPPYRYFVTVEKSDLTQLGRDMEGEEMQGLLSELHRFAGVVQLMLERFVWGASRGSRRERRCSACPRSE